LPILGYHRVGKIFGDHVPSVSVETFSRQLEFLKRNRYQVLDLSEVAQLFDQDKPLPRASTVITFDDGYVETWTIAWPILKQFGFPATVFITPAEVGLEGFMTWDQILAAANQGLTVGCHTMNHSFLPLVPEDRLEHELVESKHIIEERINKRVDLLSYPIGGFTQAAQRVATQAGYRLACTTNRRSFISSIDRFAVRRVKITEKDRNFLSLRAKLSGYYDAFRQLRDPA